MNELSNNMHELSVGATFNGKLSVSIEDSKRVTSIRIDIQTAEKFLRILTETIETAKQIQKKSNNHHN